LEGEVDGMSDGWELALALFDGLPFCYALREGELEGMPYSFPTEEWNKRFVIQNLKITS
jgi:hypothetical protein